VRSFTIAANEMSSSPPTHPNIPSEALVAIKKSLGLEPQQVDTIMSLVACPENGTSNWSAYYNYIEYGDDAATRGYTTTIFGATSGTGSLLKILDALAQIDPNHLLIIKYHAPLKLCKGGNIQGLEGLAQVGGDPTKAKADYSKWTANGRRHLDHIEGDLARLPNCDPAWRRAVWRAFIDMNWRSASDFCAKAGKCTDRPGPVLQSAVAKGFIVDMSLNHGDCYSCMTAPTWNVVWEKMKNKGATSEGEWLNDLIEARRQVLKSGYAGLDWSKSGDRCSIWKALVAGNPTLTRPIKIANSTQNPPIWPANITLA
jgi:hypothetical protein